MFTLSSVSHSKHIKRERSDPVHETWKHYGNHTTISITTQIDFINVKTTLSGNSKQQPVSMVYLLYKMSLQQQTLTALIGDSNVSSHILLYV